VTVSETLRAAVTQSAGCDVLCVCIYISVYMCEVDNCLCYVCSRCGQACVSAELVDCSLKTVCVACCLVKLLLMLC